MDDVQLRESSTDNLLSNNSLQELNGLEERKNEATITNEEGIHSLPVVTHPRLSILTEFDPLFKSACEQSSIIEETFPEVSPCKNTSECSPNKNGTYKLLDITAANCTQENISNGLTPSTFVGDSFIDDNNKECTFDENKNPTTEKLLETFCVNDAKSLKDLDDTQNINTSTNENTNSEGQKTKSESLGFIPDDEQLINVENNQNECYINCGSESGISEPETSIKVLSEITHLIQNTAKEYKGAQSLVHPNLTKTRKSLPVNYNNSIFEKKKNPKRYSLPHDIEKNVGIVKASPKDQNNCSDDQNSEKLKEKKPYTNMDISDKLEEENSDLKLQLNASQQERATLELEIRQKEEVIIKTQAELIRKEQAFKQEIKQLKQKLEEKSAKSDSENINELEETVKNLKTREARLISEINTLAKEENSFKKIMAEFEMNIQEKVNEIQKLKEEHETVKRHLANLELAFSDVHQKYERSKNIIERYKLNEEALLQRLSASEEMVQKSEEKYDSLKAHAKAQIEKIGKEMTNIRESNDAEIHKLQAIIKRLEIKNASLMVSLDQKNKECLALTALCDEVTGKV